jgi:hypothetical protein
MSGGSTPTCQPPADGKLGPAKGPAS